MFSYNKKWVSNEVKYLHAQDYLIILPNIHIFYNLKRQFGFNPKISIL